MLSVRLLVGVQSELLNRRAVSLTAAALAALSACTPTTVPPVEMSTIDRTATTTGTEPHDALPTSTENATQEPETSSPGPLGSSLEEIVPYLELTENQRRRIIIEYSHRIEDHIAVCMAREGFHYVPVDPDQPALIGTPEGMPATESEMREVYGYGVVFNARLSFQPIVMEIDDPNVTIEANLSEAERRAYGPAIGKCMNEARERYPDPFGGDSPAEGWLAAQAQRIREAAWQTPQVQEAIDGWSRCMAGEGYDFAHPDEARNHISELASPYFQNQPGADLDEETAAELDALQALELEVAHTDFSCATELDKTLDEARREIEAEFVADNADRIAGYAAEHEEAMAAYLHLLDEPVP